MDDVFNFISNLTSRKLVTVILAISTFYIGAFLISKYIHVESKRSRKYEIILALLILIILVIGFH